MPTLAVILDPNRQAVVPAMLAADAWQLGPYSQTGCRLLDNGQPQSRIRASLCKTPQSAANDAEYTEQQTSWRSPPSSAGYSASAVCQPKSCTCWLRVKLELANPRMAGHVSKAERGIRCDPTAECDCLDGIKGVVGIKHETR